MIRRDFISWAALVIALVGATHVLFALFWIGGVATFAVVAIDHVKLRRLRRAIVRSGRVVERNA